MPQGLRFAELDLYALLDADTDEARTFTTYLGYWVCLAEHVQELYGDAPAPRILAALQQRPPFVRLRSQGKPHHPDDVRALLLNAWTSELRMHLVPLEDTGRLWLANHGLPVDAYYATSRAASAWLSVRDGQVPHNHSGLLKAVSSQVAKSRVVPPPWDMCCTRLEPATRYLGFPDAPGECSNLASGVDRFARAGMLLRTTRERGVKKKVEEAKRRLGRVRAPNGEFGRRDLALPPTTLFDFAWRMRTRSNYGDPAMFYVGTLHEQRSREYARAVRTWTTATMFLFEAFVAQRARKIVEDAAVHFISRDRSKIADELLVPRMRALGLLA